VELKSFREILLKKADGNPYLQTLIKYAKDDLIAEEVLEALQKMAEPSAAMGRGANHAVTSYGTGMGETEVDQLRSALGHHISHYKGALKAHHAATDPAEKAQFRHTADQHLSKIIPMMHLAGRASKHSNGAMVLDYPSTTPWETNYTSTERLPNGKLKEGTKDLGRRAAPNANRDKNSRAVPDYRYLEMAPHPGHEMSGRIPHKGGYPFEDIQLGSPSKRDVGQAYLPIENVKGKKDFTPHPFDAHPVHAHADKPQHELGPEHHEAIQAGLTGWDSSPHHQQWLQDEEAKATADPEGYENAGKVKPKHVYDGIPLQEMEHHKNQPAPSAAAPSAEKAIAAVQAANKPAKKTAAAKESPEAFNKWWASQSPEKQKEMMAIPGFRDIVEGNKK
jgi:hypothetical protein